MKYVMHYIKKYKIQYSLGIVLLFVVDLLNLTIPELTGDITDGLKEGGFGNSELTKYILLILAAGVGIVVVRFGWRYFIFGSARKIQAEMRNDLFSHLSTLSQGFYNKNKTGDLMSHFTNDIEAIRMALGPAVVSAFDAIVMTLMTIIKMIFTVDGRLTAIACIPMVMLLIGALYYCKEADKRFGEKQEALSKLTDDVQESISGVRVIKSFAQERREIRKFAKGNQHNMDKNMRLIKLDAIAMPIIDLLIGLSSALTLIYGGHLVIEGEITLGMFVAFCEYINMLVWPMIAAGDCASLFSQASASVKRVSKLMEEKPEVVDDKDALPIEKLEGHIRFNNLSFSYLPELPKVLNGVDVDIPKGKTLAIIGKTGSGKTTVASLLTHTYNVEPGMIEIDGVSIEKIPLATLHKEIAYVPQDNFLFSDTIQANIAFGKREMIDIPDEKDKIKVFKSKAEELSDILDDDSAEQLRKIDKAYGDLDEVQEAAKKASVHDNIMDFPDKYSAVVGERGVTMSGGQKQRSSIARALMKDAPILILDDALSAVDTDTEEIILGNLKSDREGKTTIIIAHRITTIQNADIIMVLDDGKVAELGSHDELIKLGGLYCRLYEKQQLENLIEIA